MFKANGRQQQQAAKQAGRNDLSDDPEGGHCQAALAASIFHFKETTVGEVKAELRAAGVLVREPVTAV